MWELYFLEAHLLGHDLVGQVLVLHELRWRLLVHRHLVAVAIVAVLALAHAIAFYPVGIARTVLFVAFGLLASAEATLGLELVMRG